MVMARNKTVLVVDDDEAIREGLALVLRDAGYAVVTVGNVREALDHLHHNPAPDLVLLDMMMPEDDGWAFLRARYGDPALAGVPVMVMTAIEAASPEWATPLGTDGFLPKPVDMALLLAEVSRHLESQRAALWEAGEQVPGW
jgi:CheY-like chemotaxis protein